MTPISEPARAHHVDRRLVDELSSIASEAAAAILGIRAGGVVRRDKADGSPVTEADGAAEAVILDGLRRLLPGIPVISEEASAAGIMPARAGQRFLLVDPLDGTREFLAGIDEYTVNIALIDDGRPVAGVIAAPGRGTVWTGIVGLGAERMRLAPGAPVGTAHERMAIRTRERPARDGIALVSRSHREPEAEAHVDRIAPMTRTVCGSSLKFCRIADGTADVYVRIAALAEWDVAAGQAVLTAAGGAVLDMDGRPLVYGGAGQRLPSFIAAGGA